MRKILILLLAALTTLSATAQRVDKKTYVYTHRDEVPLYLDIYSSGNQASEPCLLYIFGGAFLAGSRAEEEVVEVYEHFARKGWKVVAIDYRLGLLPLIEEPEVKRGLFEFRSMLIDAIDVATEDLLEATLFLVSNAEALGIDPEKIVTLGASAGAITACQAEWAICNNLEMASALPEEFNYAGVISQAGAICSSERQLEWAKSPCPMMLFHGDADSNVPLGKQSLLSVSLFGSEAIAASLQKAGASYWFYEAENMDHNFSWRPMYYHREEMEIFAERIAFGGQQLQIHLRVKDNELPEKKNKFGLMDYVEANFAPGKPHGVEAAEY